VEDPRGTENLFGHFLVGTEQLTEPADNVIIVAKTPQGKWVEACSELIGPFRNKFTSTYLHWSLAINGLFVAAEKYGDERWKNSFIVNAIRKNSQEPIVSWSGEEAKEAHLLTVRKMASWGFIEMYALLEDFVLDLYVTYHDHDRTTLVKGDSNRELRRLKRAAESTEGSELERQEWENAWTERLEAWRKKKLYDGLHKVFLAFFTTTGLKKPESFTQTSPETWAKTLEAFGLVRHSLIHGAKQVGQDLADISKLAHVPMEFIEGEKLNINFSHLQVIELFCDQILGALNLSLAEHDDAWK